MVEPIPPCLRTRRGSNACLRQGRRAREVISRALRRDPTAPIRALVISGRLDAKRRSRDAPRSDDPHRTHTARRRASTQVPVATLPDRLASDTAAPAAPIAPQAGDGTTTDRSPPGGGLPAGDASAHASRSTMAPRAFMGTAGRCAAELTEAAARSRCGSCVPRSDAVTPARQRASRRGRDGDGKRDTGTPAGLHDRFRARRRRLRSHRSCAVARSDNRRPKPWS